MSQPSHPDWRRLALRLALVALLLGGAVLALRSLGLTGTPDRATLDRLMAPLGAWAPAAFTAIFALWVFLALPSSAMNLAGGALFGVWLGTLVNVVGCAAGAIAGFLTARYLARDFVASRLDGKLASVDRTLGDNGFVMLLLVRLASIFPFGGLSYAAGISAISTRDFIVATLLGMFPSSVLWTYMGTVLVDFSPQRVVWGLAGLAALSGLAYALRGKLKA